MTLLQQHGGERRGMNTKGNKAALVVGVGGLGRAIVANIRKTYPTKRLILADRNQPNEILDDNSEFIQIDIAKDDLSKLYGLEIDMLVYSAGIGRLSSFDTFTDVEIVKNFSINTLPAIRLIRAYYEAINGKADFYCAVISSIAGYIASPLYGVYSATKAALVKFVEAVNAELRYFGSANRILDVAPGKVNTAFHKVQSTRADIEEIDCIAGEIVENMLARRLRYIPKEKEVYADVIARYQKDGVAFAQDSVRYKMQNNATDDKPQIKVGYLTGTFDLFHIGHLNLLRNAKKYCDKLVVGIHPDGSHKGKEVFIPLDERIEIVKNIKYVDDVIVCKNEDIDAYEQIKYDYLFVGSDYQGTDRFKRYEKFFENTETKIIYLPYTTKTSSTKLRSAISDKISK